MDIAKTSMQQTALERKRHQHSSFLRVADEHGERARLPVKHDRVQRRVVVNRPRGMLRIAQHLDHVLHVLRNLHLRRTLVARDRVGQAHIIGVHHVVRVGVPVRTSRRRHEHAILSESPLPRLRCRRAPPPGRSASRSPAPAAGGCGPPRRSTASDGAARLPDSSRPAGSGPRTRGPRRSGLGRRGKRRLPDVFVIR